eukprot:14496451-Alexandrium_andersonii.AAC.1
MVEMLEPPRLMPASLRLSLGEILGPRLPTDRASRDPPSEAAADAARLARGSLPPSDFPSLQPDWVIDEA